MAGHGRIVDVPTLHPGLSDLDDSGSTALPGRGKALGRNGALAARHRTQDRPMQGLPARGETRKRPGGLTGAVPAAVGDCVGMTTYLVNHLRIPNGVPSPQGLEYLERVEDTFLPYDGRWLVLDAQVEVLEGACPGSVVLMEFPGMATAKKWYFSPEYQETVHLRADSTISGLILVDPVDAGFTSKAWTARIRDLITAGASRLR
jgi:uncharacterized protein (DUF1330 family)